jgi:phenylacetate-coenzyme A ligase PaaK-like adenylate-forming protein
MLPAFDPWHTAAVGFDVLAAAHADAPGLQRRRERRWRELLAAARGSRWYAACIDGRDPATLRLQDLPVARKTELMRRFGDWVTDPRLTLAELRAFTSDPHRVAEPLFGRYTVWESSGSSGEPAVFVQDAFAMAVYDALEATRRAARNTAQRWLDPWALAERFVFVGAIGGHFASTVSVERLRRLNPWMAARLASLSFLLPTRQLVAQLQALAPTVLATYPSAAVLLAEEQAAGRLQIAPREVWTGGETLTPATRAFVEQSFGCPVSNSYGASEFLSLAFECRCGRLHLNSDWAVLEPVDEAGQPVPQGQMGATTLLTNLANHVQPIIRYDLGDRVVLAAQPCECGSALPVIDVQGRCDDALMLRSAAGNAVRLLPLALCTVLEDDAGLFDFQLVQRAPDALELSTALHGEPGRAALQRGCRVLTAFLAEHGAAPVRIDCHAGRPATACRSGKRQRVMAQPSSGPGAS